VLGRLVVGWVPLAVRPSRGDTARAMSQENIDTVRSWFDRWNAGDREAFLEEIHADAELVTTFLGGRQRGPEAVRRWFREIEEQFDEWTVMADKWCAVGDLVATVGRVRLRGRGSGVSFETPVGWLFEIRDGKLSRLQTFVEHPGSALEAAGLRE
jgi:ketosteroid isomerase-like protein